MESVLGIFNFLNGGLRSLAGRSVSAVQVRGNSWHLFFAGIFLFWFLGLVGVLGGTGWMQAKKLEDSRERLAKKVSTLTHEKEVLQSRLKAMKSDPFAQEVLIRQELTYAKPSEFILEFPALDTL